jgi:hypothetical protein
MGTTKDILPTAKNEEKIQHETTAW